MITGEWEKFGYELIFKPSLLNNRYTGHEIHKSDIFFSIFKFII